MQTVRAWVALLTAATAACFGLVGCGGSGSTASPGPTSSGAASAIRGCPTNGARIASLFGEAITHVEGAVKASSEQVCAFSTSSTDVGALSVSYLRFPRPELDVNSLSGARRRYGTPMAGHTVVSMPSWGTDAFLDESIVPARNLVAEFAWVPGFEIVLGMHADDPHVVARRQLINQLVAFARKVRVKRPG